jgi:hypothetical protein
MIAPLFEKIILSLAACAWDPQLVHASLTGCDILYILGWGQALSMKSGNVQNDMCNLSLIPSDSP